jgi:hypothetical protein
MSGSFASDQKKVSSVKQVDLRDMLASTIVCTSTVVVSPDPLFPTPTSSAVKTPENVEEDPDYPEAADKGDKG